MTPSSSPRARRFLAACRGEPVDTTPVWIMRQAGRYLPEYRALRVRAPDFLTFCKTPALAAEATLQPVAALDVDAAILFSDILVVLEAMGAELTFIEGEGPRLEAVRDRAAAENLRVPVVEEQLGFVLETIRLVVARLAGEVPLIGFTGAPWTLLAYLVEGKGSHDFARARRLLFEDPALAHLLLGKIADACLALLRAQARAGAAALQLFDSWAGLLAPDEYRAFALPYVRRVFAGLADLAVPRIYFVHPGGALLEDALTGGADVLAFDQRTPMREARARLGPAAILQGNLDPCALFAKTDEIRKRAQRVLEEAGERHIFNLGHGILPETSPASARALVEAVHELGRRSVVDHA